MKRITLLLLMSVISLFIYAQDGIGDGMSSFKIMAKVRDNTIEESSRATVEGEPYVTFVDIDCTDAVITFKSKKRKWEFSLFLNLNPRLKYKHTIYDRYESWSVIDANFWKSVSWHVKNNGTYELYIATGIKNGKVNMKSLIPIEIFQVDYKKRKVIKGLTVKEFSDYMIRYMEQFEK